jgi:hypothetical protein
MDKKIPNLESHIRALAASLVSKKEVAHETKEQIDKILSSTWKSKHDEEILLFRYNRTILRPDYEWINELEQTGKTKLIETGYPESYILDRAKEKTKRSCDCMYHNYSSFLNVVFAATRFLEGCLIPMKKSIPERKIEEYAKTFYKVFLDQNPPGNVIHYYPQALEQIGKIVHLQDRIQELCV